MLYVPNERWDENTQHISVIVLGNDGNMEKILAEKKPIKYSTPIF